jgi:hypothetical protein
MWAGLAGIVARKWPEAVTTEPASCLFVSRIVIESVERSTVVAGSRPYAESPMKWLPSDSWEVQSPLSVERLVRGIARRVGPVKAITWPWGDDRPMQFQGTVDERGFSVSRIQHFGNTFVPHLAATFVPNKEGTTIRIRMIVSVAAIPFMAAWCGGMALGTFITLWGGDWVLAAVLGSLGVCVPAATYASLWEEARRSRRRLSLMLKEIHREAGK